MTDTDQEDHFVFLDELRESGVTNMYGAGSYLEEEFGLNRKKASTILGEWMRTFSDRHPARKDTPL
ncbi:hypothetical protein LCGC14_2210470 [marine sediment metagenome]|uniref:Uncharacterized protein n=1 Tax=marine sediment metagenome TaxID=412755 RepID=A0A0F9E1F3_9ZZZZ